MTRHIYSGTKTQARDVPLPFLSPDEFEAVDKDTKRLSKIYSKLQWPRNIMEVSFSSKEVQCGFESRRGRQWSCSSTWIEQMPPKHQVSRIEAGQDRFILSIDISPSTCACSCILTRQGCQSFKLAVRVQIPAGALISQSLIHPFP